ncbi:two-component regulator propeller domain-containing protein [Rhabdobacter roseus]|uniref:histidine kinase n=1 Tax=Rhabdobacter roseus TaxID=1655419 RepID=A0A840TY13_9BACT|nr:two-component regulator propeller domain-containing protein [Rhabdobacter roseus]MBB5286457.1 ligand-binding sensor domain-containing protein/signal transduction histidine kinase/CheY-like chemotaxis protein [Rhabdobacter roseus]
MALYTITHANAEQPTFTALTSLDGLSSNTVQAIMKDRQGLLWFATDDGLNRYDGTEFIVYRHEKGNPASLGSNDVSALYEDRKGQVWVGSIQGSLSLYDRKKDSFTTVVDQVSVTAITSDRSGKLWVATMTGLLTVDPDTRQVVRFSQQRGVPDPIANQQILSLYEDHQKRMWIGTYTGLYRFGPEDKRFRRVYYERERNGSNSKNQVKAIVGDPSGTLWVGTSNGLHKLSPDGELLQTFRYQAAHEQSLNSNMIYALALENREKLWICTDGGLNILEISTGKISRYTPDARRPFSLTNKSIRSILIDKQGIFWLGTYKGGVNKYDKNVTRFGLIRSEPYDPFGLSAPFVTSFAEKGDGNLFVGTDGGGLNLYQRQSHVFSQIPISPKNKLASTGLVVLSLELSSPDRLWIGTFQDGLFALNPATGRYQQYTQGTSPSSLSGNDIFCLTTDKQGKLWIGTNGGGVNVFDPSTQQFARYFDLNIPMAERIIPLNGFIRAIHQDRKGRIWVGSHGTGLAIFDPKQQKSLQFDKQNSNLPSNIVLAIYEDIRGKIWVGTGGNGLATFDEKTGKFILYGQNEGLSSGVINKILEDAQGRIWVSTNQGVSYLDPHTRRFINYTQANGLQNNTFVLGAGLRTSDDLLFFGGVQGINYLDTHTLKHNTNQMPVLLKELRVGNKTITPADSAVIQEHISIAKSIQLDYKQNFSISYAALNYSTPLQTVYRYRLVGFDTEWHEAGLANTASYTNLSPGSYQFEVQAKEYHSNWPEQRAYIQVIVSPPFYMTVYAYLFYGIALFGLLFFIRHRGIQKLKATFKQEQHEREKQRKREMDAMKIKFLTNLSHELRTPIALILAPLDHVSPATSSENTTYLQGIKRNAKRLLNLVDQLLDFKNLLEQESKLDPSRGEIVSFIKESAESFRYLSQRNGVTFVVNSQVDSLYMDFDANKLERIVFNLLSNAFKFTPKAGMVTLSLSRSDSSQPREWLYIQVSDTGVGIPADKREHIFERFFQHDSAPFVLNQGSGIGLSIVKEFVQMHQGFIKVDSIPGSGSTFTVGLPNPSSAMLNAQVASSSLPPEGNVYGKPTNTEEYLPSKETRQDLSAEILVIEDNEEFRHHLRNNLVPFYHVIEAANGKVGWQKALSHHPKIIVSDIAMPEMDGIQLCHKIKSDKRTAHIPIILLTASSGEEQELRGLNSGANDYLTKPFNFDILNAKIGNLLLLNRLLKSTYSKHIEITCTEPSIILADEKLVKDIVLYIDENLINNAPISVEKLSKHLGMSRGTLYSKLLEITGQTPIEFIRAIKLEKAAILLEKSDMNISQIAFASGFATPNYFSKSFKSKFNMLPSEYKATREVSQE